jgi:hypothetical protein
VTRPLSFALDTVVVPAVVVARGVGEATVLLNTASGRYFTLDRVGSRAWACLTSTPSLEAAFDALLEEFAVEPDRLRQDLESLIGRLEEHGLLEIRHA